MRLRLWRWARKREATLDRGWCDAHCFLKHIVIGQEVVVKGKRFLLYRGVHARHPALSQAKWGVAVPGNQQGTITPREHNLGRTGAQEFSPYTSFTHRLAVARIHALRRGPGGIILTVEAGAPRAGELWHWEWSPDEYYEEEVLLFGRRDGLGVIPL